MEASSRPAGLRRSQSIISRKSGARALSRVHGSGEAHSHAPLARAQSLSASPHARYTSLQGGSGAKRRVVARGVPPASLWSLPRHPSAGSLLKALAFPCAACRVSEAQRQQQARQARRARQALPGAQVHGQTAMVRRALLSARRLRTPLDATRVTTATRARCAAARSRRASFARRLRRVDSRRPHRRRRPR